MSSTKGMNCIVWNSRVNKEFGGMGMSMFRDSHDLVHILASIGGLDEDIVRMESQFFVKEFWEGGE